MRYTLPGSFVEKERMKSQSRYGGPAFLCCGNKNSSTTSRRMLLPCLLACGLSILSMLFSRNAVRRSEPSDVGNPRLHVLPQQSERWIVNDDYIRKVSRIYYADEDDDANGSISEEDDMDDETSPNKELKDGQLNDYYPNQLEHVSQRKKDSTSRHSSDKKLQKTKPKKDKNSDEPPRGKHSPHSEELLGVSIRNDTRPPLSELISDRESGVVGSISFLLDFAILGHAKCATSFVMRMVARHPEVAMWDYEVCDLYDKKPAALAARLYEELPEGNFKRGFKCPGHFSRSSLRYFRRYFKNTGLIVGLRHPVRWFESFYNFRVRHGGDGFKLPEPNKLIGECTEEMVGVCTDRANFHASLGVFGKTNLTNPSERNLLRFKKKHYATTTPIHNRLFLYDVAQLYDLNSTRMDQFKEDLRKFIGLKAPMPDPDPKDTKRSSQRKAKSIDICSHEFQEVRNELVEIGKRASMWIRKYLLLSDEVYVSSREYFESVLMDWKVDPCLSQATNTSSSSS